MLEIDVVMDDIAQASEGDPRWDSLYSEHIHHFYSRLRHPSLRRHSFSACRVSRAYVIGQLGQCCCESQGNGYRLLSLESSNSCCQLPEAMQRTLMFSGHVVMVQCMRQRTPTVYPPETPRSSWQWDRLRFPKISYPSDRH